MPEARPEPRPPVPLLALTCPDTASPHQQATPAGEGCRNGALSQWDLLPRTRRVSPSPAQHSGLPPDTCSRGHGPGRLQARTGAFKGPQGMSPVGCSRKQPTTVEGTLLITPGPPGSRTQNHVAVRFCAGRGICHLLCPAAQGQGTGHRRADHKAPENIRDKTKHKKGHEEKGTPTGRGSTLGRHLWGSRGHRPQPAGTHCTSGGPLWGCGQGTEGTSHKAHRPRATADSPSSRWSKWHRVGAEAPDPYLQRQGLAHWIPYPWPLVCSALHACT